MADPKNHKEVMDYLIATHSPVINGTIRRMKDKYPHLAQQDHGDLYESAVGGLMSAAANHDPDKGASLSSYAAQKMGHAMLQRFKGGDVSATDSSRAAATRPAQSQERQQVQSMATGMNRGAIESAGGTVSDDGASTGVSVIRNQAADFARQNPHIVSELQRKNSNFERRNQPIVQEAPPAPPAAPAVEKPKSPQIIIRRKQVESSLAPEQTDRMSRIDSKKGRLGKN